MGNSVRRVGLLNTAGVGEDEPFRYQLGNVSIDLSRKQGNVNRSGSGSEKWTMKYTLGESTCTFNLRRSGGIVEGSRGLLIELLTEPYKTENLQEYGFHLNIQTLIKSNAMVGPNWSYTAKGDYSQSMIDDSKQIHAGGSVTETHLFWFGTIERGGLIVLELKKKTEEEQPYAVTLAHYFAASANFNFFPRSKTEVGLSVVATVRVSNGNLDITVEGPDQHPTIGLRYLFAEAMETKIWKLSLCPHCANIQKQRSTMIGQSDSEDSESVSVARRRGGSQRDGKGIDNSGRFIGDGNANYIENYNNFFVRRLFGKQQRSTMIWQSDSEDSESVPLARRHGGTQKNVRGIDNGGKFNGNGNATILENKNMFCGKTWW